jgi:hypothetical protein
VLWIRKDPELFTGSNGEFLSVKDMEELFTGSNGEFLSVKDMGLHYLTTGRTITRKYSYSFKFPKKIFRTGYGIGPF